MMIVGEKKAFVGFKDVVVLEDVALKEVTSFKIGGSAPYFIVVNTQGALEKLFTKSMFMWGRFYLLGMGSNILASDERIRRPVLQLGEGFNYIKQITDTTLEVGARTPLAKVLGYTMKRNLEGLEPLAGIPATIGGLVVMNASSFGASISSFIKEVTVLTYTDGIQTLKKEDIYFGYRSTSLKDCIILSVRFRLALGIKGKYYIENYIRRRFASLDYTHPSAGCVFRNLSCASAGRLIDSCGLKGFTVGRASVSLRHANVIVNNGEAKAEHVAHLIEVIKERVYARYAVLLKEEITRWQI